MIKNYYKLCKENIKYLYCFFISLFVISILELLIPNFISKIIDNLTIKNNQLFLNYIIILFVSYTLLNLFSLLSSEIYSRYFRNSFIGLNKKIVNRIYNAEENDLPRGRLINSTVIDSINIAEMADYFFNVLRNSILITIVLIIFLKTNIFLGLILLFSITIYIYFANKNTKKSSYHFKGQKEHVDKIIELLNQTLNGIKEIKTSNITKELNKKYDNVYKGWSEKYLLKRKYYLNYNVKLKYIRYIVKILLYLISALLYFNDYISIGIIIMLSTYLDNLYNYANELISSIGIIRNYNISLNRILLFLDINNNEDIEINNKVKINEGKIEFKNVDFSYKDTPTIKNISFIAKPNEITVITGKTGVGKTTIFNLLLKLYKPDDGEILLDDVNIEMITKEKFFKYVSVVNQESFLFDISIRENLGMSNKNKEKQIEICKKLGIHNFIISLPDGYNTILKENANILSGGQKRLLVMAKVLLNNTKVILFDELTSSLDDKTTNTVIKIIKELKKEHTIIIITHKEKIMNIADNLIILKTKNSC